MEEFDKLGFCLQSHNRYVIATLLINEVPLYDYIICQHAELQFDNEKDRQEFIFDSYHFQVYSGDPPDEETLFYYNFPENLMPADPKHDMIGFSPEETLTILSQPFLDTNENQLSVKERNNLQDDLEELTGANQGILCLVHVCGSTGCSHIQMNATRNNSEKTITLHSFQDSFGTVFHPEIQFTFKEEQYLMILKGLEHICKESKDYADYQKFQTERFYRENPDLFK